MKQRNIIAISLLLLSFWMTACANTRVQSSLQVKKGTLASSKPSEVLVGKVSWYGTPFHGRRTANGEIYNMYAMTAAHKSLPFGTRLLVVNPTNDRSLVVRINDRGPYIAGRIVDLSYAAAKELDMVGSGVAQLWMAVYPPENTSKKVAMATR